MDKHVKLFLQAIQDRHGDHAASRLKDVLEHTELSSLRKSSYAVKTKLYNTPNAADWYTLLESLVTSYHSNDPLESIQEATAAFLTFSTIFRSDGGLDSPTTTQQSPPNWSVGVLSVVLQRLRDAFVRAWSALVNDDTTASKTTDETNTLDEKVNEVTRACRQLILFCQKADERVTRTRSRITAIPYIVNTLLSTFFCCVNLDQCRAVLQSVDQMERQGLRVLSVATRAQIVTYYFYLGRMRLVEQNYKGAVEALSATFTELPSTEFSNKSVTLFYLTVAQLCLGVRTDTQLLQKYECDEVLADFGYYMETGNVAKYRSLLWKKSRVLRTRAVYALLDAAIPLVFLNTIKRCHGVLSANFPAVDPSRISLDILRHMLVLMEVDAMDGTEEWVVLMVEKLVSAKLV
eukprot:PhF_6_TR28324/c0_g1_i2/m.41967